MRGKHIFYLLSEKELRITPAGAGKTQLPESSIEHSGDHPRRCGENHVSMLQALLHQGSPPQVRGKLSRSASFRNRCGITPAGAGKTYRLMWRKGVTRDHPRRCGENTQIFRHVASGLGSPPQVRGKLFNTSKALSCLRITPAGAGKTIMALKDITSLQDHPRRCGENLLRQKAL